MDGHGVDAERGALDAAEDGRRGVVARLFVQVLLEKDEGGHVRRQVDADPPEADGQRQAPAQRRVNLGLLQFDADDAHPNPNGPQTPRQSFDRLIQRFFRTDCRAHLDAWRTTCHLPFDPRPLLYGVRKMQIGSNLMKLAAN